MTITLALGVALVTITQRSVLTRFVDGTQVDARAVYDPASLAMARDLGYQGSDLAAVDAMTREHDLMHTVLALAGGLPCSPTLWRVAHGLELDDDDVRREEQTVLDAQRRANWVLRER